MFPQVASGKDFHKKSSKKKATLGGTLHLHSRKMVTTLNWWSHVKRLNCESHTPSSSPSLDHPILHDITNILSIQEAKKSAVALNCQSWDASRKQMFHYDESLGLSGKSATVASLSRAIWKSRECTLEALAPHLELCQKQTLEPIPTSNLKYLEKSSHPFQIFSHNPLMQFALTN